MKSPYKEILAIITLVILFVVWLIKSISTPATFELHILVEFILDMISTLVIIIYFVYRMVNNAKLVYGEEIRNIEKLKSIAPFGLFRTFRAIILLLCTIFWSINILMWFSIGPFSPPWTYYGFGYIFEFAYDLILIGVLLILTVLLKV